MTSTYPIGTIGSVASFLAAIICRYRMSYCKPSIYVYDVFILDLNCNCSYCLLAQFVLTILSYSKLDVIEIAHKATSFQINKPSAPIVHIVDLFIYIYIALFPGRLYILYGCTLNHIQFCLWLCCTHLHFLSLEIQKSSPWLDIHILENQLQDMTKKNVHRQMWGRSIENPWLRKK
jgi:hypothetical protein